MPDTSMSAVTTPERSESPDVGDRLAVYGAVRRRAVDFLLENVNADGSIGPTGEGPYYYRVPWALALAGETAAAMGVLGWIRRRFVGPDGTWDPPQDPGLQQANTYFETCLAYGAHLLRQYDVARLAMAHALRSQDPATGGVFMLSGRTRADDVQLLFLTCQLGMSALLTGERDAAIRAGGFCLRLWQDQPDLPGRLFTMATRGGIVTEPPPGIDRRHVVNDGRSVQEYHYNGGIAAAFLGQLHAATGEGRWLEAAKAYQRFSMESTDRQFETKQVCKSAWGASILAVITREDRYRDWLVRMGDWFAREQEPGGYWNNTPYLDPSPTQGSRITVTAEFIVHVDSIIGALSDASAG